MASYITLSLVFLLYTLLVFALAWWGNKRSKKKADYLLGNRSMGGFVTALSVGASDMSSWLLMALPALVFKEGVSGFWLPVALTLGAYINWVVVAKPLRLASQKAGDALTLPAYLSQQFQNPPPYLKKISAGALCFFSIFYSVGGFVATGKMMALVFPLTYHQGLWLGGFFIFAYTALGGYWAISWIDVFQGLLMFFALLLVPLWVYGKVDGIALQWKAIGERYPAYWSLSGEHGFLYKLSLFAWGLGYMGQPHIVGRFMAIKNPDDLPLARRICTLWMALSMAFAAAVGLVGRAHYGLTGMADCELVFIHLSADFFAPFFYAIFLCALISSIMSTLSALLLLSATTLLEDLMPPQRVDKKRPITHHRWAMLFIAVGGMLLASVPGMNIMESVAFPWCGLGACFGPALLMSLNDRSVTPKGIGLGILVGAGMVVLWQLLGLVLPFDRWHLKGGFSLLAGFFLSLLLIIYFRKGKKD